MRKKSEKIRPQKAYVSIWVFPIISFRIRLSPCISKYFGIFLIGQKRYGAKCKVFAIKYLPDDMGKVTIIEKAIAESGKSNNEWIKMAIDEKLERDKFL